MTATLPTYTPSNIHVGGARLSTSMLDVWTTCPQLFFLHYLAPHPNWPTDTAGPTTPTQALGLELPSNSKDLLIGAASHAGLHAYRLASVTQGARAGLWTDCSLDAALSLALDYIAAHKHELTYEAEADEVIATTEHLLRQYHHETSTNPLLQWTTAFTPDGTTPALEQEYEIPIAGGRFLYTVKVDALGYDTHTHRAELRPREYKTCSRNGTSAYISGGTLKGQGMGELAILYQHYPAAPFSGGLAYELLVKDRGRTSQLPTIEVVPISIHARTIARWLDNVETWALQIAWAVRQWEDRVSSGTDPWLAGLDIFPSSGQANGSCMRFNRECTFAPYCRNADLGGTTILAGFRPRAAATPKEPLNG